MEEEKESNFPAGKRHSRYKGPHLLEAIDTLHPPKRDYEKPPLMPICDVVKTHSVAQVSACGKVEAGALQSGSKLEFHIHHAKEAARVVRIVSLLDPKTGKETKKAPRCLVAKQRTVIELGIMVYLMGTGGISMGNKWLKELRIRGAIIGAHLPASVLKHVERATDNSTEVIVTYEGQHDRDILVLKKNHHQMRICTQ